MSERAQFVPIPLPELLEKEPREVSTRPEAVARGPRDRTSVPTGEFYGSKARELRELIQVRYAVPAEMLDALGEADFRETIEDTRLALKSLPIGTVALERVAATLSDLKRKRVG